MNIDKEFYHVFSTFYSTEYGATLDLMGWNGLAQHENIWPVSNNFLLENVNHIDIIK